MSLSTRRVLAVVATLAAMAMGACSDGDSEGTSESTASTTTAAPSSTEASTTTTSEPAPTAPSAPTAFTTEARDAVNELKDAWEAGDQARARAIAPGEVVDALFPIDSAGFEIYGCDLGQFETSSCNFRNRSTGTFITVAAQRFPEGWQISNINVNQG